MYRLNESLAPINPVVSYITFLLGEETCPGIITTRAWIEDSETAMSWQSCWKKVPLIIQETSLGKFKQD